MIRKIKNVKIINYNSEISNSDITIQGNKIIKINKKEGEGEKILVPGFFDIHYHYRIYNDYFKEENFSNKKIKEELERLYKEGTTKVLITSVSWQLDCVERFVSHFVNYIENNKDDNVAKIIGINLEGPFISKEKMGMQWEKNILEISNKNIKKVQKILKIGKGLIKIMTIAPELKNSQKLIDLLKSNGVTVSLGHSNISSKEANKYFSKDVPLVTHLWNAVSGIDHHAHGGGVLAAMSNSETNVEFISRGHSDEIIKITYQIKGSERIILVSDYGPVESFGDGEYFTMGKKIIVKNNQITNLKKKTNVKEYFKKISNDKIPMIENIQKIVKHTTNPFEIVKMSSYNALKLINLSIDEIEEGYDNGSCLLSKDFQLLEVI